MAKAKYFFNSRSIYICPGSKIVMLERYEYELSDLPIEKDGHICLSVKDFETVFSKVFSVKSNEGKVVVSGCAEKVEEQYEPDGKGPYSFIKAKQACVDVIIADGIEYIPVDTVLVDVFGFRFYEVRTVEQHKLVVFTCDPTVTEVPKFQKMCFDSLYRGKDRGDLYRTFWFEAGEKIVPYFIYIPMCYDGKKKLPVLFVFHGGGGTPTSSFERCGGRLQDAADKNGYIMVGVDAFIRDSFYGYILPPSPGDGRTDLSCPENPLHMTPERIAEYKLGEKCAEETIREVCEKYAVDTDNMFLMGNSMGGHGSFYFSSTHPKMFNAVCPQGAMIYTKLFDLNTLKGIPYYYIGGTEDEYGFDYLYDGVQDMLNAGVDMKVEWVGGGQHPSSWTFRIDEIFEFFNAHLKK